MFPSASVAVTVPIVIWFSAALKDADEVNTGGLSFKLFTLTVIFCEAVATPSLTVIVAVYEDLVS